MSNSQNNKQVAMLLRQIADQIERGDTSAFDSMGPQLRAVLFERKPLLRPTPTPAKPKPADPPRIFFENGIPHAMGIVKRRVELMDAATHSHVQWPHNPQQLSKFMRMPMVKREFWSGEKRIYGDALRLAVRYGLVVKKGKAYEWSETYTPLARREFAKQFYPKPV